MHGSSIPWKLSTPIPIPATVRLSIVVEGGGKTPGMYWPVSARNGKRPKVVIGHLLKRVLPGAGGWTSPEAGLYGATKVGVQQEMSLRHQKEMSAFSEIPASFCKY